MLKNYNKKPYNFEKNHNNKFKKKIFELTIHHKKNCDIYKNIVNFLDIKKSKYVTLADVPFIPTRLFKDVDLLSVKKDKIVKTLLSSGTSNDGLSRIYLDKNNSINQIRALSDILSTLIGNERVPMIIVDKNPINNSRKSFNARVAAIYGFSIFGKNIFYLLDSNNKINYEGLKNFLLTNSKKKLLIFGFTSFIYEYLVLKFKNDNKKYDLSNSIILHGGGWKKLEDKKVSNKKFKNLLFQKLKVSKVVNYYGTVEQTGSIFLECEKCGNLKTSIYSDIIIRDNNFKNLSANKTGIIQLISVLPSSYPGHSILTEDLGMIIHEGNCQGNLGGKCFKVLGRVKKAEIRGCSDTGHF